MTPPVALTSVQDGVLATTIQGASLSQAYPSPPGGARRWQHGLVGCFRPCGHSGPDTVENRPVLEQAADLDESLGSGPKSAPGRLQPIADLAADPKRSLPLPDERTPLAWSFRCLLCVPLGSSPSYPETKVKLSDGPRLWIRWNSGG